jgi:hypothetical protein
MNHLLNQTSTLRNNIFKQAKLEFIFVTVVCSGYARNLEFDFVFLIINRFHTPTECLKLNEN